MGSKTSDQMRTPAVPATCDLMSDPHGDARYREQRGAGRRAEVIAGGRCCPAGGPERDFQGHPSLEGRDCLGALAAG